MEQKEQNGAEGNTKPQHKYRGWCLTINNYKEEDIKKIETFEKYVYQIEKGKLGTEHLQGYVYSKNPRFFNAIKKEFPLAHIEQAKGTPKQNFKYCTKIESRIKGPFYKGFADPIRTLTNLRPWQKEIVELIINHDWNEDRLIYWIVDYKGGIGKTALAKYICLNFNAIYLSGKSNDIKYAVAMLEEDKRNKLTCIFDFPRSLENYISYQAIEEIKNGIFFCCKYKSQQIIFNSPIVICFSNFYPNLETLSKDRWVIKEFNKEIATPLYAFP